MSFATARTITLQGAVGHLVDVQVDVADGVVATSLVGRPDASISEARDRCRAAVVNTGLRWPSSRRVTILLSPADLPKRGSHFDLAIAIGVLAASGQVPPSALRKTVLLGELTLDGRLRTVPAVLPMVLSAAGREMTRVFVPEPQVHEASLVPGVEVLGVRSLSQVVALLHGLPVPDAPEVEASSGRSLLVWRGSDRLDDVDMADLRGIEDAKYAVEVAAAGGHHVMLTGPKGAGKTSLAERIPSILPDLTLEESLELTAVHSLAGILEDGAGLVARPPFVAPHHNTSKTALLGGGTGQVRPGELSRTHCGVLLLDEFPLLHQDIVEALRQPLESGEITIARGEETATYPARGMFVLACNLCPCGTYSAVSADGGHCNCREVDRREYRRRLGGPVVDRIDVTRNLLPRPQQLADDPFAVREPSAVVRERVAAARDRQAARYAGCGWRLNGHVPGHRLRADFPLTAEAGAAVDDAVGRGTLSQRGLTRVHRLAWSVADLAGVARPGAAEAETALALRLGDPLPLQALTRRAAG